MSRAVDPQEPLKMDVVRLTCQAGFAFIFIFIFEIFFLQIYMKDKEKPQRHYRYNPDLKLTILNKEMF